MPLSTGTSAVSTSALPDLEPHLALVSHVVRQLAARTPSHVSREDLWSYGAVGLAIAAREQADGGHDDRFASRALRQVRRQVIDGLRRQSPVPADHALADSLGVTVEVLRAHRHALAAPAAASPSPHVAGQVAAAPRRALAAWAAAIA